MNKVYLAIYKYETAFGDNREWNLELVVHTSKAEAIKVAKTFYEKAKLYRLVSKENVDFYENDEEGVYEISYRSPIGEAQTWYVEELEVKE